MSPDRWENVKRIFSDALDRAVDQRDAFVASACTGDLELRGEVERLLALHGQSQEFLETPAVGGYCSGAEALCDGLLVAGSRVGSYTIHDVIGDGGMGVVYRAVQDGTQRTVALKLLRAGLTNRETVKRFEQETRLLGRLQHPGIAQILEAGTSQTEQGARPFFAMELVEGLPANRYAQEHDLSTSQRLDLLAKIADAVHHAHQKGIIHRDLKPANILVDASGQPKVLDFGVARATDSDVYVTTLRTDIGKLIGTIPYMSPEQVAGNPNELDTRSDVYALGVVGYELLTGRLPYDLADKPIPEAIRIIGYDDPTPLSSISRVFRGDIETILGKALDKDRARRYLSAAEFASDIRHYLRDEPIVARPPSAIYQVRKFAVRHKGLTGGTAAVLVTLIVALINVTWERNRALEAEQLAEVRRVEAETQREEARSQASKSQAMNDFLQRMLASVDPDQTLGRDVPFRAFLDQAAERVETDLQDQPEVQASVRNTLGRTYRNLGFYEEAESHLRRAVKERKRLVGDEHPQTLTSMNDLALTLQDQGKISEAEPLYRHVLDAQRRLAGTEHPSTILAINNLGWLVQSQGKYAEAEKLYREALELRRRVSGEDHHETLRTMINLSNAMKNVGKLSEAVQVSGEAVKACRRALGEEHPTTLYACRSRVWLLMRVGRLEEAETLARRTLELDRKVLGGEHPHTFYSVNNLASVLMQGGRSDEAEILYRQLLEARRRKLGDQHPETLAAVNNLALSLHRQGKRDEAEPLCVEVLEARRRVLGPEHPRTLGSLNNLGNLYREQGRYEEAKPLLVEAMTLQRRVLGGNHPETLSSMQNVGALYLALDRADQAEPLFQQVYAGRRRTLGDHHSKTLSALRGLVVTLSALKRFEDAELLAIRCFELSKQFPEAARGAPPTALDLLIDLYDAWGKREKAAEYRTALPDTKNVATTRP